MKNAQLTSHVDTDIVSRAELKALPAPEATATFKPIPHIELVDMLDLVLQQNQIRIEEERFALRRDGSVLFGVLQLAYGETDDGSAALGLRTANNKTMSIQICAGLHVTVCSNMAFRGDMIALRRKHTSGLNLRTELSGAVLRFQEHFGRLASEVELLKKQPLIDMEAKALIHDAFTGGLMPVRFLPEVSQAYFEPQLAEFEPRTAWSLHNAFTGAAKAMPITTRLPAIQALGKFFGMSAESPTPASRFLPAAVNAGAREDDLAA
jgi:Domain of unknown function (DUF932)